MTGEIGTAWGETAVTNTADDKLQQNPATRNRTRDHLIAAAFYSQMLYQLSYSRDAQLSPASRAAKKHRPIK